MIEIYDINIKYKYIIQIYKLNILFITMHLEHIKKFNKAIL